MKTYKSFLYLMVGLGFCITFSSCKKQLENVIPQDKLSTSLALSNASAAQALYTGAYADLRNYVSQLFTLGEMRSEIWTDGLFTENKVALYTQFYDQNIHALNAPYSNWANFYNLLYQINNIIYLFPKSTLPAAQRNEEMAEIYGLRAYIYYTMLKTWGAIPLTLRPVQSINNAAQTYKARSPADSIMLQIKSDIAKSLELFNGNTAIPSGKRIYWNPIATLTLKGDVYIWSGTLMNGGTDDLDTAKMALQEIENLQGASLHLDADYADIFDPTKKSNNPEIIFAINYEVNQEQNTVFKDFGVNSIQAITLSFQEAASPTVSQVYPYVSTANSVGMNESMLSKLTSGPTDQRISGTFKIMYSNSPPFPIRGIMLTKYMGQASGNTQVYNNDFLIYRYADVLLLMAEAKAKLGLDPSPEINQVRERAYGSNYTPYMNNSLDSNMHAILEERLREFIGEGKRWWDLRRAGDQWVYYYINPSYLSPATVASGYGPTLELPITTGMLNNDPLLTQTEGY